jgi:autophagy-related protein 2
LARRPRSSSRAPNADEEDESVIGDFLFNSIYIGIPANKDPRELASAINHDIDDLASETGSYATGTTVTATTSRRTSGTVPRQKKLKLNRSKHHKMTFELEGVSADVVTFPAGSSEVQSSIDVRIKKLEVFDHVPTSTWKKFATYMQDAGEREHGASMVHLELLNVKPVEELSASEIVLKVSVLPVRLHVDQDALDFLIRFFEFKDDSIPSSGTPSAPPFIQRAEINAVQVKLDYKPKTVDYTALRSGRTTEFMNFIVLDRADMVLRRVILYGVSGFDRLGQMLNNIWSPDVRRNQLPGVLAGLAPVRPLVDVTSGVRDLIAVPIREYRKDGRIVRSIQKGAFAFAKTTATELVNLGAKMAIGTQQILQNTEELLVPREQQGDLGEDDEGRKQISLYADQPIGIKQGLRTAYASLERDLLIARDAIVAVPGEVMATSSAKGAAAAILKQSPTIILRPAIGATKAVGQTLMGAGNMLDKQNLRRIDEVSLAFAYCDGIRTDYSYRNTSVIEAAVDIMANCTGAGRLDMANAHRRIETWDMHSQGVMRHFSLLVYMDASVACPRGPVSRIVRIK